MKQKPEQALKKDPPLTSSVHTRESKWQSENFTMPLKGTNKGISSREIKGKSEHKEVDDITGHQQIQGIFVTR